MREILAVRKSTEDPIRGPADFTHISGALTKRSVISRSAWPTGDKKNINGGRPTSGISNRRRRDRPAALRLWSEMIDRQEQAIPP